MSRLERFRLTDLAALAAMALLLLGLSIPGCCRAREAATRMECTNNLKQIGLAFHSYHDNKKNLPSEAVDNPDYFKAMPANHGRTSAYCFLLPYIEESKAWKALMGNKNTVGTLKSASASATNVNGATPVKIFLCPGRHTISELTDLALRDYGYRKSEGPGKHAVLDSGKFMDFKTITEGNGTGYTALLTHYWWDADKYNDPSRTNLTDGWANTGYDGHNRAIDQIDSDRNQPDDEPLPQGVQTALGSPHANANPTLFADAHVQNIPFDFNAVNLFFYYDNQTEFKLP